MIFLRSPHGPVALAAYWFGMSKAKSEMYFTHLYDHVLSELEFGRTETGINLLVGMLDAVEMHSSTRCTARNVLNDHALHAMLSEDPIFADALIRPGDPVRRVNMVNAHGVDGQVSSTGRRLFAATSAIAFTRALRQRHQHAERKLLRSWRSGQKIWLIIDPQSGLLSSLSGFDIGNIRVSSEDDIEKLIALGADAESAFDLILAPHLPDQLANQALKKTSTWLCRHLSKTGEFATSALLPGHPGAGWRRTYFNWEPQCHFGDDLASMGPSELKAHSYRDDTGCIAWVEIRHA